MATPRVTAAQAASGRRVRPSSGSVANAVTSPLAARSGAAGPVQASTCCKAASHKPPTTGPCRTARQRRGGTSARPRVPAASSQAGERSSGASAATGGRGVASRRHSRAILSRSRMPAPRLFWDRDAERPASPSAVAAVGPGGADVPL
jgi:hypothetical protein